MAGKKAECGCRYVRKRKTKTKRRGEKVFGTGPKMDKVCFLTALVNEVSIMHSSKKKANLVWDDACLRHVGGRIGMGVRWWCLLSYRTGRRVNLHLVLDGHNKARFVYPSTHITLHLPIF